MYKKRNEHEAKAAIELILKNTMLDKNARCIDLASGSGRHSIALSEKNFNVTGFDISENLLRLASTNSTLISPKPNFVRGDLRCLPFKQRFDIAVNLFTSWGYFLEDKENESVISGVNLLLKNNGYFILDFLNCDYLTSNLIPESFEVIDGISISQRRYITCLLYTS
ncbi:MAG: class I SAM-dependent methyltransferase, partial [Ignavibacteriaceae bacterium]|nr:class I SAM-dependent methyltransferase [Ignavibacteriaceae bacterium]